MTSTLIGRRSADEGIEVEATVAGRVELTAEIVEITLEPVSGALPGDWPAGSHVDLVLGDGLVRQYSLIPAPKGQWRVAVLREGNGRGGSRYIHDELAVGDRIVCRGPRNNFPLAHSPRYLFLAGGVGVTPLLRMIEQATAAGAQWRLVYCGRSRATMAFVGSLDAGSEQVVVHADDENGVLDLAALLAEPQDETLVYACGPAPFLEACIAATRSWPPGSLHIERFSPVEIDPGQESGEFEVELWTSGRTLTIPTDRSILDVAQDAGIQVLSSCSEGTCGTCETPVLAGEVDHRDSVLDDEEKSASLTMMVCVSRGRGRIVLDL
jgi:ferredoxin-NADP reductase